MPGSVHPRAGGTFGAASARSLLLTALGEFALRASGRAWTSSVLTALSTVGVEPGAARQALARVAGAGLLRPTRVGRHTRWHLTDLGRSLLEDGALRIYDFHSPVSGWDGRFLVTVVSYPDSDRALRHQLSTRLAWAGFGRLAPGVWISTRVDRQAELEDALRQLGISVGSTVFVATLARLGDPRRIARSAWNLDDVDRRYSAFCAAAGACAPTTSRETLAAQIRLVQEWRRFPFDDPGLPEELLPVSWAGGQASRMFHERHARYRPVADAAWSELELTRAL